MTQQETVAFWTNKAVDELETATIMFNAAKYLYTGFMCHQCIEKALKAYYVFVHDKRQPFQHNLEKLANMVGLFDNLDPQKKQTINKLQPLYIEARYEDEKNAVAQRLTKDYCRALLTETEVLLKWILSLMM